MFNVSSRFDVMGTVLSYIYTYSTHSFDTLLGGEYTGQVE